MGSLDAFRPFRRFVDASLLYRHNQAIASLRAFTQIQERDPHEECPNTPLVITTFLPRRGGGDGHLQLVFGHDAKTGICTTRTAFSSSIGRTV